MNDEEAFLQAMRERPGDPVGAVRLCRPARRTGRSATGSGSLTGTHIRIAVLCVCLGLLIDSWLEPLGLSVASVLRTA